MVSPAPIKDHTKIQAKRFKAPPPRLSHLKSFYAFRRLPPELRLKIWKLSILPRLIVFISRTAIKSLPVPAILHTNREARRVGKENYKKAFRSVFNPTRSYSIPSRSIYFNFILDTICFEITTTFPDGSADLMGQESTLGHLASKRSKLRNLAIHDLFQYPDEAAAYTGLMDFPNLQRVVLLITKKDASFSTDAEHQAWKDWREKAKRSYGEAWVKEAERWGKIGFELPEMRDLYCEDVYGFEGEEIESAVMVPAFREPDDVDSPNYSPRLLGFQRAGLSS